MQIQFSPPDIGQEEFKAVQEVLESGWLTTGPKAKEFEKKLAEFCGTQRVAALSSGTSALEICLRLLDIGPGDEVITSAYTYTASASVIYDVGATPVLVDVAPKSYHIDPAAIEKALSKRTKAIIAVDYAGVMCEYNAIRRTVEDHKTLYNPAAGTLQEAFETPAVIADATHSFGAKYFGKTSGQVADFSAFSFHAVKNLVTGEGGALTWRKGLNLDDDVLYRQIMLLSLHGQTKDALAKTKIGAWEYDIVEPYYKCNFTDISAALGLVQLERYDKLLRRRHEIIEQYNRGIQDICCDAVSFADPQRLEIGNSDSEARLQLLCHTTEAYSSSGHLYPVRFLGYTQSERDCLINKMAESQIPCNVHYKPLPLLSAYSNRGFAINQFPYAFEQYSNEMSIPLHTLLDSQEIEYILTKLKELTKASKK